MVQSDLGQVDRDREPGSLGRLELRRNARMIALHKNASGKTISRSDTVDPGDGVFGLGACLGERNKLIDANELSRLVSNLAAHYGSQLDLGPCDESRKPEATDGRGEPVGIQRWAADEPAAVRSHQLKAQHMVPEGSGDVMVFAVNVVGDSATYGDVLGAGGYREEEATRYGEIQYLGQRHSGLAAKNAGLRIEVEKLVETPSREQRSSFK